MTQDPYHPQDSPYYGLSIKHQRMLAALRRGRRKTPKKLLKVLHRATSEDYSKLLLHCVKSLLEQAQDGVDIRLDRIKVKLMLPFNFRKHYGEEFPRVVPLAFYDWSILVSVNADRLIEYLRSKGVCAFTPQELRRHLWAIRKEWEQFEWLHSYTNYLCLGEFVDNTVTSAAQDRVNRGRRHYRRKEKKDVDSSDNNAV